VSRSRGRERAIRAPPPNRRRRRRRYEGALSPPPVMSTHRIAFILSARVTGVNVYVELDAKGMSSHLTETSLSPADRSTAEEFWMSTLLFDRR